MVNDNTIIIFLNKKSLSRKYTTGGLSEDASDVSTM